ncbi:hypothetical protein L873DRAFT_1839972 [Choiromyces venosus 120613-1]|uniref:Histone chaperone domain-containing protein n=1 Tax=Choiromyces venosus 120613-1 TaxID=1336337 RepID=A0A3N4KHX2_9PEZI|nr:hypothetical protein L873DRAFT_1839972 [Choiromyces venosus 120613-1]
MSDITAPSGPATENPTDKGKGKAIAPEEEVPGEEGSDSSDDEIDQTEAGEDSDVEEDDLSVLDTGNILAGRRTRGKQIDFAKAAEEQPADEEEDDDDEEYAPAPAKENVQRGPGNDEMDTGP